MALLGALESIKSGTTTLVENSPGIDVYAAELAKTGLRWVFAESARDAVVPAGWRPGEDVHEFSPALREAGLQRIHDLFATWHKAHNGLITVFPPRWPRRRRLSCCRQCVPSEQHDLGYTIHLAQSRLEIESMMRLRGVRPSFSSTPTISSARVCLRRTAGMSTRRKSPCSATRIPLLPTRQAWLPIVPSSRPFRPCGRRVSLLWRRQQ